MTQTAVIPQKSVHVIPAQVNIQDEIKSAYRQLRVAFTAVYLPKRKNS